MDFNDMFSLRRPRDAKAGLASGAKSIGKGLLAGAWESSRANCTVCVSYGRPLQLAGAPSGWVAVGSCRESSFKKDALVVGVGHQLAACLLQVEACFARAGTVGLVAAPIAGAVQSGVKGFALGCAAGKPVSLAD